MPQPVDNAPGHISGRVTMTDMEKQKAVKHVRLYPSTFRRLKIAAAKAGITIAAFIDQLSRK